jgi:hypothetical protein
MRLLRWIRYIPQQKPNLNFPKSLTEFFLEVKNSLLPKKGKAVAVVAPCDEEPSADDGEGLIRAKGALSHMDRQIDKMVEGICQARMDTQYFAFLKKGIGASDLNWKVQNMIATMLGKTAVG